MDITKKINVGFRRLALAGTVSLSVLLAACGEESKDAEFQNHLDRAQAYQDQGQFKAAIIEYRNAIKKSQRDPDVMLRFADMLNDLGDHGAARSYLEASASLDSERYYLELVETYIALGKFASANEALANLSSPTREKMLLEAELLVKTNYLDDAEKIYRSLLKNNSTDGRALHGMATVLALRGEYDEALDFVARVGQADEAFPKAKLLKAGVEINRGDLETAEGTLSELLSVLPTSDQMLPDRVVTLERLSYVLTRLGRPNEAYLYTKLLSEAFPGASQANDQFQQAMDDFQNGRLEEAKEKLTNIISEFPGHRRTREILGVISYMQGDNEAAASYLNDVIDPETANPMATQVFMAANLRLNEPGRVLAALEPTIANQTSTELLSLYGLAAISDGQFNKGEKALLKAEKLEPENSRVLLALASYYRIVPERNDGKELEYLLKAKEAQPTQQQVLVELASYYERNDQSEKAESMLRETADANPTSYAANYVAGQYLVIAQALEDSSAYLSKAVERAETDNQKVTAQIALARNALIAGDDKGAVNRFTNLVDVAPKNVQVYAGLHAALVKTEGKEVAIDRIESLAREKKNVAAFQALIQLALADYNVARAQRAYDQAMSDLGEDAKSLEGSKSVIDYFQALDYLKTGQLEQAKEVAAKSLIENPGNPRVVAVLAEVEIKSGNLSEAEKLLERLSAESEGLGHIVPALKGDLAFAKEDLAGARVEYEAAWAISKTPGTADKLHRTLVGLQDAEARKAFVAEWNDALPNNPLAMLLRGMDYQAAGEVDKAADLYAMLLEQRPESVAALNNLGWIYFERQDERALDLLSKAAELAPNSPAVLDSYGWVLHKFGRTEEGLVYLKKAAELMPDNEEIVGHYEAAKNSG